MNTESHTPKARKIVIYYITESAYSLHRLHYDGLGEGVRLSCCVSYLARVGHFRLVMSVAHMVDE